MNTRITWRVFWALAAVFVVTAALIFIPPINEKLVGLESPTTLGYIFLITAGVAITGLAAGLIFLTAKTVPRPKLRAFLLLAEASFLGIIVFAVLHNVVSGMINVEEPVFFVLALLVCPLGLLTGIIGSAVLAVREKNPTVIH